MKGAGGHVSVRDAILLDHFRISPHGKSFSLTKPEDLYLVYNKGAVVGRNMYVINSAGYSIHSAVILAGAPWTHRRVSTFLMLSKREIL